MEVKDFTTGLLEWSEIGECGLQGFFEFLLSVEHPVAERVVGDVCELTGFESIRIEFFEESDGEFGAETADCDFPFVGCGVCE
jgi:hypothetical protein